MQFFGFKTLTSANSCTNSLVPLRTMATLVPGPSIALAESTASTEARLREILSHINQADLVQLRQLLPEYLRTHVSTLTPSSQVQFDYRSNVISTLSNHPIQGRVDVQCQLKEALQGVSRRELHVLRQLVPQYLPNPDLENPMDSPVDLLDQPRRFPHPVPPPTRCRSRSRSPELVPRSFVARCSMKCCYSGCGNPCGKPIFALGPASHIRHYCQEHRTP